ncbi:MAG: hypothetical protein GY938_12760 [Ketobacter sp.]|nr:hypothetical protein [Ketobacter sp.]
MVDVNTAIIQLDTDFNTLVPAYFDIVYDYRTFPDITTTAVSLSFDSQGAAAKTMGGDSNFYDFTAIISVQPTIADGADLPTEAAMRIADHALNDQESNVYSILMKGGISYKNTLWNAISFPEPSQRGVLADKPYTRVGEIPFRLHMK